VNLRQYAVASVDRLPEGTRRRSPGWDGHGFGKTQTCAYLVKGLTLAGYRSDTRRSGNRSGGDTWRRDAGAPRS
jgi:hypothetical protein